MGNSLNCLSKNLLPPGHFPEFVRNLHCRMEGPEIAWRGEFIMLQESGLYRVSTSGGEPESLLNPDPDQGEAEYALPQILPGGKDVLFTI